MSRDAQTRPATEADVQNGKAVFCIPDGRSQVYDLGVSIPAPAKLAKEMELGEGETALKAGTSILVVQAEIVDGKDVLVGFRVGESQFVCSLEEIALD